jgi:hypothetical protein
MEFGAVGRNRPACASAIPSKSVTAAPPNLGVIGCCYPPFHAPTGLFQFDDRIGISQRYAIDFLQLDDQVNSFAGDRP